MGAREGSPIIRFDAWSQLFVNIHFWEISIAMFLNTNGHFLFLLISHGGLLSHGDDWRHWSFKQSCIIPYIHYSWVKPLKILAGEEKSGSNPPVDMIQMSNPTGWNYQVQKINFGHPTSYETDTTPIVGFSGKLGSPQSSPWVTIQVVMVVHDLGGTAMT